jgi:FkbM family methyltransferase
MPYYGYLTVDMFDCPAFVMFTNNDSPTVSYIIDQGTFEPCSMALWCALAREASGIVDIGANVGIYSLCAAALRPEVKIHAFEPNPYAFARLRMHKHVNECSNLVEHTIGLADKDAAFKLTWVAKPRGNISSGAALDELPAHVPSETAVMTVTTLDRTGIAPTLGTRPIVKIDVEGAEARVLRGASDLLALRPDMIIECLHEDKCDEINQIVLPLGYSVYGIYEDERLLRPRERLLPLEGKINLNQFLTVRTPDEMRALRLRDAAVAL